MSDRLEELRSLNKALLEKLKVNREELKTQRFTDRNITTCKPKTTLAGCGRSQDPALQTSRGSSSAARKALCPPKPSCPGGPHPLGASMVTLVGSGRGVHSALDVIRVRSPVKRISILNSTMIDPKSDTSGDTMDFPPQYMDRLEDDGNLRSKEQRTPKSILLTPNRSSKRDLGRVTFLCDDEPPSLEPRWSSRPLLGYDWIAGLLEVKSPITNKSDQFFSEISEFRRVNREECAHEYFTESGVQDSSVEDLDISMDTHQCVYCYRVNQRLFTSPVGAEPACPVCKKRRGGRHVLEEPAFIRVSIPRSTLLPPYKYRAHRRKSFDPTDSLALPSHCLAGWENSVPSCDLKVTSLDLKTSTEPKMMTPPRIVSADASSYFASRATSDNLLNLSRSIAFHHRNVK
ncbi:migration and invasion-inhibitory protein [Anomaloglossus baeobatrachus]|uniref:migration and invasion-inhibitory protein n=1 Tax=Anomaloglossus baeobatrachus TaxID=238106 RepID=UPI003F503A7B